MRKVLMIMILCCTSCAVEAQKIYKDYLASVREFMNDWAAGGKLDGQYIVDNARVIVSKDDSAFFAYFKNDTRGGFVEKTYKIVTDGATLRKVDSTILTSEELDNIYAAAQQKTELKWTAAFLPADKIIKQKAFDSVKKECRNLIDSGFNMDRISSTNYSKHRHDSLEHIYEVCYAAYKTTFFYTKDIWRLGPPLFIRGGTFCVLYSSWMDRLTTLNLLTLYKKENGHWQYFGKIYGHWVNN